MAFHCELSSTDHKLRLEDGRGTADILSPLHADMKVWRPAAQHLFLTSSALASMVGSSLLLVVFDVDVELWADEEHARRWSRDLS